MSAAKNRQRGLRIAILGAGPGGLCMAIRLQQAGCSRTTPFEGCDEIRTVP